MVERATVVRKTNNRGCMYPVEKAPFWLKEGREPIELCGLHWKKNVEEIKKNKIFFEDRYIEIKYETFVNDVRGTMHQVTKFCELSEPENFFKMLPKTLPSMNYKWEKNLTEKQKLVLERILKEFLRQLNYD